MEINKKENEKLIKKAQDGDKEAVNRLLFNYDSFLTMLCYVCIKQNKNVNIELSELKHVARIALFTSLKNFNESKASFNTYVSLIVRREVNKYIYDFIKRNNELKKFIYFEDFPVRYEAITYEDLISDKKDSTTNWYEDNESFDTFYSMDEKYFSKKEKNIVMLKLAGYTRNEISKILKVHTKASDRAIRKIKQLKSKN